MLFFTKNHLYNALHKNVRSQFQIKAVENIDYRLRVIPPSEKGKLKSLFHEMYGEKNCASFDTFHRINLTNTKIRMLSDICLETRKITSHAAGFVNLEIFGNVLSWTHPDGPRHINVSGSKKAAVYIGIQSPFRFHEFICMVDSDMMEGLSFY